MSGRLHAIWVKPAHRAEMTPVDSAWVVARSGLDGDINQGSKRQVTLLSSEAWNEAAREVGREIDPVLRRANLLISGVDLEASRGRTIRVGEITILVRGETKPCQRMDEACAGLRERLAHGWRGGVWGEVLESGELALGDAVCWLDDVS